MHTTGNNLTGDYAATAIGTDTLTTDENITGTGISSTLHDVVSGSSTLTNTGNDFSGAFVTSDKENNTTVLSQSGHNASGTYTLTEDLSDNPTIDKWGDGIDGIQTISQTGEQIYNFYETNVSGSATDSLSGFGDNPYTLTGTDNANTGDSTRVQTGTEEYELQETTWSGSTEYFMDNVGFDTYTQSTNSNSQSGVFTQTTTGDGTYSGSGFANGAFYSPLSDSGSTSFSTQEIANTRDGSLALTQTGTTRYSVLKSFNNTSDGANGGAGIADFSPVGLPVMVGRASVPAGVFSSVGDDRYDYCFAAGTMVVMKGGERKAIEAIEPGEWVMAVPDSDPTAEARPCRVARVFHNAPARLLRISVAQKAIRCTANHPFYVHGKGWVTAAQLQRGDELRDRDGRWIPLDSVADTGETEAVFNLQVDGAHTYFVESVDGGAAVLVHNESTDASPNKGDNGFNQEGRVKGAALEEHLENTIRGTTSQRPVTRTYNGVPQRGVADSKTGSRFSEIGPASPTGAVAKSHQMNGIRPTSRGSVYFYQQEGTPPGVAQKFKWARLSPASARTLAKDVKAGSLTTSDAVWTRAQALADETGTSVVSKAAWKQAGNVFRRGIKLPNVLCVANVILTVRQGIDFAENGNVIETNSREETLDVFRGLVNPDPHILYANDRPKPPIKIVENEVMTFTDADGQYTVSGEFHLFGPNRWFKHYFSGPQWDRYRYDFTGNTSPTIEVFGAELQRVKKQVDDEVQWRNAELERLQRMHPNQPVWLGMDADRTG